MKATRRHHWNELGRHSLHDLVASGDSSQELPAGSAGDRHKSRRQDGNAWMGEHEGGPFVAGEDHFRVDKGGPSHLPPLQSMVAAPPPPTSSSCISAGACRLAGMPCATNAEISACNVTPLARSTTCGENSSYASWATNAASSRLRWRIPLIVDHW